MDDFEKKDLQSSENESAGEGQTAPQEEKKSPTQVEDDLVKELEGIRDLLQNELDAADGETEIAVKHEEIIGEDGELIQELDEIDESASDDDEDEPKEKRICACCGEKECDDSFGEDYPYCSDCRKLMTASPVHVGGILMAIVMIVVACASLFFCAKNITGYMTLIDAETAFSEKRLIDAATSYNSYLQQNSSSDDISLKAVKNLIEIFSSMGYYNDASTLVNTYGETSASIAKKYAKIPETYASFLATSSAISSAIGDVINSGEKFDYDEKAAELDKILEEGKDKEGTEYSKVFVEYYKYVLMSLSDVDFDKQLEQLLKVKELDNDENRWIYMPNLVNLYAREGDGENAGRYFEECMKINTQESDLYLAYANAFRFGEKIDADKILEIADRAKASWPSNAAAGYQQIYAIGYLLKGDGENAMKAIEEYVGNQNYTVTACNLYALCSLYVKDNDGYQKMVDLFKNSGKSIGKTIVKYKNGKMTLEEVLTDKGGDI